MNLVSGKDCCMSQSTWYPVLQYFVLTSKNFQIQSLVSTIPRPMEMYVLPLAIDLLPDAGLFHPSSLWRAIAIK